ncbi:tyrosine-type recombinase/integrase [Plantibacter sp. YIM 135347]|uniref:tyrosine-type recombinase/integrase n=1 Tax=Plantibacter sp. YIM 135347 TaxID=3423919 RepID=UPI003D342D46
MITTAWAQAIDEFCIAQRAGAIRETSIRARREHLQHLARRVEVGPWEVSKRDLTNYTGRQKWAPETRRGRRTTFNEFWRWGKRFGYVSKNPVKALTKVKATKATPNPVPEPVYAQALRKADPRTALMLRLAHDVGMRRGEIAVVHSDDLIEDLLGWSILAHGKGGKRRILPLTRRLALEIRAHGEGYLFEGAIDGHLSPRRVGELTRDAIPGDWTVHKLRHSFSTRALKANGGNVFVVQQLMGHASAETTRGYTYIDDEELRRTVEAAYEASVKATLTPKLTRLEVVA